jgi:hypothetical protein
VSTGLLRSGRNAELGATSEAAALDATASTAPAAPSAPAAPVEAEPLVASAAPVPTTRDASQPTAAPGRVAVPQLNPLRLSPSPAPPALRRAAAASGGAVGFSAGRASANRAEAPVLTALQAADAARTPSVGLMAAERAPDAARQVAAGLAAPGPAATWEAGADVRMLSLRMQALREQSAGLGWDEPPAPLGTPSSSAATGLPGVQAVRANAPTARVQVRMLPPSGDR